VPDVLEYDAARPGYSSFDRACMRMNVRDIGVADEQKSGYANLMQPGEGGSRRRDSEGSKWSDT
jgi:hypothetical protein